MSKETLVRIKRLVICLFVALLITGCEKIDRSEIVTVIKTYHTSGDLFSSGKWTTLVELPDGKRKKVPGNTYLPGESFVHNWVEYRRSRP